LDLLDHIAPTRAALQGEVDLVTGELPKPTSQPSTIRLADLAPLNYCRLRVRPLEGDLSAMDVEPTYDRHGTSSGSRSLPPAHSHPEASSAHERRRSPSHAMFCRSTGKGFRCRPSGRRDQLDRRGLLSGRNQAWFSPPK